MRFGKLEFYLLRDRQGRISRLKNVEWFFYDVSECDCRFVSVLWFGLTYLGDECLYAQGSK